MSAAKPETDIEAGLVLTDWLHKHHAAMLWRIECPEGAGGHVEAWCLGWGALIVRRYPDGGWEVFTAAATTDIAATLSDVERRMGIAT